MTDHKDSNGSTTPAENAVPPLLADELRQFTGTEYYYKFSTIFPKFVLTDGAKYLAEKAGAYWLMDAVASHMPGYEDTFAVATLRRDEEPDHWVLTLDDGNGNVFATQAIEYSDFPLDEIKLYLGRQGDLWVIMLTSEY
jgi:hypothetical protein